MNDELKKAISDIDAVVTASQSIQKSNEGETMDELLKTIRKLGPEGLRKALPNLSESQKELLNEVLSKAKDMTKQAQMDDNKKPQKAKEPVTEEVSNSPEGVDEADEKLMSESNKTQNHQGGPDDKPEGWKGEVVKSGDAVEAISEKRAEEIAVKEANKESKEEVKEHVEEMHKAEGEVELEKLEKSELLSKMVERMRKRGMHRGKCMEAMKKKGYDCDMADKLWEDQEKMAKAAQEPKKDDKKIEKSIPWRNPQQDALGARTHGRNAAYSVSEEIIKSEERKNELKKSNETFFDGISAPLKKSEGKLDINDMLEKGMDRDGLKHAEEQRTVQRSGAFTVSSFSDEEFLKAWPKHIAENMRKLTNKPEKTEDEKAEAKAEKQEKDLDEKK